jgi:hypothetical protein
MTNQWKAGTLNSERSKGPAGFEGGGGEGWFIISTMEQQREGAAEPCTVIPDLLLALHVQRKRQSLHD